MSLLLGFLVFVVLGSIVRRFIYRAMRRRGL
jgi:hypothetical protein